MADLNYTKHTFADGDTLTAEQMNVISTAIEDSQLGIEENQSAIEGLESDVGTINSTLSTHQTAISKRSTGLYYDADKGKLHLTYNDNKEPTASEKESGGISVVQSLDGYSTTEEVNAAIETAIAGVDVSEQLVKFVSKEELPESPGSFVYKEKKDGVISTKTRAASMVMAEKPEDDDAVENVDYYVGEDGKYIHYRKIAGTLVPVGSTDSGKYYRATFGMEDIEGTPTKNVYSLYEVDKEPTETDLNTKPAGGKLVGQFVLSSDKKQTIIALASTTAQELAFTKAEKQSSEDLQSFKIGFTYSSQDSDDTYYGGKYELFYNDNLVDTGLLEAKAEEKEIDVTNRITEGAVHRFKLKVTDDIGTIKVLYWTFNYIRFTLEETFNASTTYGVNTTIPYTVKVSGAGFTKTVTVTYNGKTFSEQVIESEKELIFNLPSAPHGRYLVECSATAQVNSNGEKKTIEANKIRQDVIRIDGSLADNENAPIIASGWRKASQEDTYVTVAQQYDSLRIPFYIYNKNKDTAKLTKIIVINGVETQRDVTTEVVGANNWSIKVSQAGTYVLTLIINEGKGPNETITLVLSVKAVTIYALQKLAAIEGYKILDFNAAEGKNFTVSSSGTHLKIGSNLFGYTGAEGEFTIGQNKYNTHNYDIYIEAGEDFDWRSNGYRVDEDGDTYFLLKAGSYLKIKYNPFYRTYDVSNNVYVAHSISDTGLTAQFLYAVKNASTQDEFLTCYKKGKGGIIMKPHLTTIQSGQDVLSLPLSEEDIIDFGFTISPKPGQSFGIEPKAVARNNTKIAMIMGYEDGVSTKPIIGDSVASNISLEQNDVDGITIGSEHCDVHIYRLKMYSRELSDEDMLNSFVVNSKNGSEMLARDSRNNFSDYSTLKYEPTQETDYKAALSKISKDNPGVSVILIQAPKLTQGKNKKLPTHKIANSKIYHWYTPKPLENPTKEEQKEWEDYWGDFKGNWVASGSKCYHIGQGTSSSRYGAAGFNIDIDMTEDSVSIESLDKMDQTIEAIQLSPDSQAQRYFNIKMNIASSENTNNALLQERYEKGNPFVRPIVRIDEDGKRNQDLESRVRSTMEFHNCILFIQETSSPVSGHIEHPDSYIHFYGIGNIGDSKKTDESRLSRIGDPFEFIVEIQDYNRPLSEFPLLKETTVDRKGTDDEEDDEYLKAEEFLSSDAFDEELTYGYRFAYDEEGDIKLTDLTDSSQINLAKKILNTNSLDGKTVYDVNVAAWKNMYKDIVSEKTTIKTIEAQNDGKYKVTYATSPETTEIFNSLIELRVKTMPDDWKSKFEKWFVPESAVYYSLFTTRYTMVDNRAKNSFWHFSKVYYTDAEAASIPNFKDTYSKYIDNSKASADNNYGYRWDLCFDYDNDTSLGIDNAGLLRFEYGYDDQDKQDGTSSEVFRCSQSTFFCRLSECYGDGKRVYGATEVEDSSSFNKVYSAAKNNIWSDSGLINDFDEWQNRWPERFWKMDVHKKYIYSYDDTRDFEGTEEASPSEFLTTMANGRKKYQRRQFERNQHQYMGVKYRDHSIPSIFLRSNAGEKVSGTIQCSALGKAYLGYGDSGSSKSYAILRYPQDWNETQHSLISGDKYFKMSFVETDMACVWGSNYVTGCEGLGDVSARQANLVNAPKIESLDLSATTPTSALLTSVTLKNNAPIKYLKLTNTPSVTTIGVSAQTNTGDSGPATKGLASLDRLETLVAGNSGLVDFDFADAGKLKNFIVNKNDLSASEDSSVSLTLNNLNSLTRFDYDKIDNLSSLTIKNGSIMSETSNSTETVDKYDSNGKLVYNNETLPKPQTETFNALPSLKELLMHYFNQDRDWTLSGGNKATKLANLTLEGINMTLASGEYLINRPANYVSDENQQWLPASDDYGLLDYLLKLDSEEGRVNVILKGNLYCEYMDTLTQKKCKQHWPELTITYRELRQLYEVVFKDSYGEIIETRIVQGGEKITLPTGPEKTSTIDKTFTFSHWKEAGKVSQYEVVGDVTMNPEYIEEDREYTIHWMDDQNLPLHLSESGNPLTSKIKYGQGADIAQTSYGGTTVRSLSKKPNGNNYYVFTGWEGYPYKPEPTQTGVNSKNEPLYSDDIYIKAKFDEGQGRTTTSQTKKPLKDMTVADIETICRNGRSVAGLESSLFSIGEKIDIQVGWDPDDDEYFPQKDAPIFDLQKSEYIAHYKGQSTQNVAAVDTPRKQEFNLNFKGEDSDIAYIDTKISLFDGNHDEFSIILDYRSNDKCLYSGNFKGIKGEQNPGGNSVSSMQKILDCYGNGTGLYKGFSIIRSPSSVDFLGMQGKLSGISQLFDANMASTATEMIENQYIKDESLRVEHKQAVPKRNLDTIDSETGTWSKRVNSDWTSSRADRVIIQKKKGVDELEVYIARCDLTEDDHIVEGKFYKGSTKHVFAIQSTYSNHNNTLLLGCGRDYGNEVADTYLANATISNCKIYPRALSEAELQRAILYPKETLTFWLTSFLDDAKKNGNSSWYDDWTWHKYQDGTEDWSFGNTGIMLELRDYLRQPRIYEGYGETAAENYEGWKKLSICKWLNGRIIYAFPYAWQSAIKNAHVHFLTKIDYYNGNAMLDTYAVQTTQSRLFIPCYQEYKTTKDTDDMNTYSKEGPPSLGLYTDNSLRQKFYNIGGIWFNSFNRTRSPLLDDDGFKRIGPEGGLSDGTSKNHPAFVSFAFVI